MDALQGRTVHSCARSVSGGLRHSLESRPRQAATSTACRQQCWQEEWRVRHVSPGVAAMDVYAKTLYLIAVARKTKATVKQGRCGSGATGAVAWLSSPPPPPPLHIPQNLTAALADGPTPAASACGTRCRSCPPESLTVFSTIGWREREALWLASDMRPSACWAC